MSYHCGMEPTGSADSQNNDAPNNYLHNPRHHEERPRVQIER